MRQGSASRRSRRIARGIRSSRCCRRRASRWGWSPSLPVIRTPSSRCLTIRKRCAAARTRCRRSIELLRATRRDRCGKQNRKSQAAEGKDRLALQKGPGRGRTLARSTRRGQRPEDRPARAAEGEARPIAQALRVLGRRGNADRARTRDAEDRKPSFDRLVGRSPKESGAARVKRAPSVLAGSE